MNAQNIIIETADQDGRSLYRVGGISALVFGIAYVIIIALYIPIGAPPSGPEARLAYYAGSPTLWWIILGLSVLTDLLLVPVALSLYLALKDIHKNMMLVGTAFVALFIVLDLALTWTNIGSLIHLSTSYAAATKDAQRALFVTVAMYPASIVESNLLFVYNTLTLSIGILIMGFVMGKGSFSRSSAYLGLLTGILGIISVTSSFFSSSLSSTSVILASMLTTVWAIFIGYRLYRLGQH